MNEYDCAIIGGGIAGLTLAYNLSKQGKKIILIEKDKNLGGMLKSVKRDNYYIEEFYHHILPFNDNVSALINELGLKKDFIWKDASTSFYYDGKFYNMTIPFHLLTFKPLNFFDKIRLGLFLLRIKLIKNPAIFDNIPAEEFIKKNAGDSVYLRFFKPLLSAKYGKNLNKISSGWFIDRINIRNKRGYKGETLGYLEGGFEKLIEKLVNELKKNKCKILTGKKVEKMVLKHDKAAFLIVNGKKIYAKDFVSTISGKDLIKLCSFPQDYIKKLNSLNSQSAICILIGLKKKLTNFYWTNLIKEDISFRAIIEHTNFMPIEKYGEHLVYLASYPDSDSDVWNLSDKQIFERYFKDLEKIVNINLNAINWYKVIKEKEAGLIYETGILKKIMPVETPISNIYIAGMLNSYPDRNLEQSIILANKVVNLILKK